MSAGMLGFVAGHQPFYRDITSCSAWGMALMLIDMPAEAHCK